MSKDYNTIDLVEIARSGYASEVQELITAADACLSYAVLHLKHETCEIPHELKPFVNKLVRYVNSGEDATLFDPQAQEEM